MKSTQVNALQIINSLKFSKRHWQVVCLCSVAVIFDGYELQMLSFVMPILAKEWGLNPVEAGMVASMGFAGMLFGSLLLGFIGDYIGRKKALMIGLGIFSLFMGISAFAQSHIELAVFRFLAGLGMGGVLPIGITLISEFAPAKLRVRTIALVTGGLTFGFAIAATIAVFVIPNFGWRPMFFIGAIPLLLIPIMGLYMPESTRYLISKNKREEATKIIKTFEKSAGIQSHWIAADLIVEGESKKSSIGELWSKKYRFITLRSTFMYIFLQIVVVAFNFWLPTLLINKGFSLVRSFSYGIEQGLMATTGGLLLGWIVDKNTRKYGRKYSLAIIFLIGAVSLWIFGYTETVATLYVMNGLAAMLIVGGQNIIHSLVTEVYPTRMRSTSVGWGLGVGRIGSIIGPTIGGFLLALNFEFKTYFVLFSIPLIVVSLIILTFPKHVEETEEIVETNNFSVPHKNLNI